MLLRNAFHFSRSAFCLLALVIVLLDSHAIADEKEHNIAHEAAQLLRSRCANCHGAEKAEGNLRLDTHEAFLRGGDRGEAFSSNEPSASLILQSVTGALDDLEMPPKQPLTDDEKALLATWLEHGAPWYEDAIHEDETIVGDAWTDPRNPIVKIFGGKRLDLWSFKPMIAPKIPELQQSNWPHNEVDYFVLAKLEAMGKSPMPPASPEMLIRRLSYDLTGLPPRMEDISVFTNFEQDDALEQQVDRMLASPEFGEHWARFWLDIVRYSDSNGFDWDEFRPQAWRYRDYVIRSLNADKPYDQFIREQLAGDELVAAAPETSIDQDALIATGYLRMGPFDNAAKLFNEQDRSRHELLTDLVETTGSAFLGMTLSCCRCHDHKFDPLSQADHFRMRAFFASVQFADEMAIDLAHEQLARDAHNTELDKTIAPLQTELDGLISQLRLRQEKPEAKLEELRSAATAAEQMSLQRLEEQISALEQQRRSPTNALLMIDQPNELPATFVLYQGDHKAPRDEVQPGIFTALNPMPIPAAVPARQGSSGRRLALANWIVSPDNPLTARVIVNRVWQSLMGQAIVSTPGDFGLAGNAPDNPELLDLLALQFVEQGWSLKKLIRTIVLSQTYRQSPTYVTPPAELAHALRQPRRLTGEQLRDSILCVSELLTTKRDGAPMWPDLPREVLEANPAFLDDNETKTKGWYPSPKNDQYCRSIFLVQKRTTRVPFLEVFDQPDNSVPCVRRGISVVAPQAISLLNSDLAIEASRAFASRIQQSQPLVIRDQIELGFTFALQRVPTNMEADACESLVNEHGLAEFCRVLLNLNEFVYVD